MSEGNDDVRDDRPPMNLASASNSGVPQRVAFNPWYFERPRPSERANWLWLAIAAALGLLCVIYSPRDDSDLFRALDLKGGSTTGWPWRFHEQARGESYEHGRVALIGYRDRSWALPADLLVAALMVASLPALRTFNLIYGRFVWSLRDMLLLMCGAGLFFSAFPHEAFLCFGLVALGAAPAFIAAPAAVLWIASWGWRRLVRHPNIATES